MRIQSILVFAATATLSLGALAEPSVQRTSIAEQAQSHAEPLRASRMYAPTADEARYLRGTYRLDDGRELVVSSERSRVYAELDGKTEELVPVASRTFVARDSRTRIAFNEAAYAYEVEVTPAAR